jgi:hypothetical protein
LIATWAEFWVKLVFAAFMLVMGIIFLRKGFIEEEEVEGQKYFKLGLAMFALMTAMTRIFFLISDYQVLGTKMYNLFWKLAVISSFIALIFIMLVIETYLVKTKYIFSIIGILGAVTVSILDIPLAQILNIPLFLVLGGEIFALYLYLTVKSPGELRTKSLLMLISLLVFSAGLLFDAESFSFALFGADLGLVGAILMWAGLGYYLKLNY